MDLQIDLPELQPNPISEILRNIFFRNSKFFILLDSFAIGILNCLPRLEILQNHLVNLYHIFVNVLLFIVDIDRDGSVNIGIAKVLGGHVYYNNVGNQIIIVGIYVGPQVKILVALNVRDIGIVKELGDQPACLQIGLVVLENALKLSRYFRMSYFLLSFNQRFQIFETFFKNYIQSH